MGGSLRPRIILNDIPLFHTDISAAIAERVAERLLPATCQRFPSAARPRRPAAYQAFLEGHHVFKNVTDEGLWKARHYWKKAVRKDPNYAKAFAGLAEFHNMLGITGLLPALDAMVQSLESATRALV